MLEELGADEIRPLPRRTDNAGPRRKTRRHAELFLRVRSSVSLVRRTNDDRTEMRAAAPQGIVGRYGRQFPDP
jgi:hypothetical protein